MKTRIVKENNRYYPEYYVESYFFGLLGGYWKRYKTDELVLNGIYTSLETVYVSFASLQAAEYYFKKDEKVVFNKDNWELNNNL